MIRMPWIGAAVAAIILVSVILCNHFAMTEVHFEIRACDMYVGFDKQSILKRFGNPLVDENISTPIDAAELQWAKRKEWGDSRLNLLEFDDGDFHYHILLKESCKAEWVVVADDMKAERTGVREGW